MTPPHPTPRDGQESDPDLEYCVSSAVTVMDGVRHTPARVHPVPHRPSFTFHCLYLRLLGGVSSTTWKLFHQSLEWASFVIASGYLSILWHLSLMSTTPPRQYFVTAVGKNILNCAIWRLVNSPCPSLLCLSKLFIVLVDLQHRFVPFHGLFIALAHSFTDLKQTPPSQKTTQG
ncbi:hypothetical protein CDAR_256721 [Caerostris darwini]|uniref:Vomeronasal type-1 receptor n=1 Tax=Caerostris darwini TaxID=1538125 RepID=A0AAV4PXD3_9ARAC|nr:hypothetical protein CDAR_256721 [Caerostris darwini]